MHGHLKQQTISLLNTASLMLHLPLQISRDSLKTFCLWFLKEHLPTPPPGVDWLFKCSIHFDKQRALVVAILLVQKPEWCRLLISGLAVETQPSLTDKGLFGRQGGGRDGESFHYSLYYNKKPRRHLLSFPLFSTRIRFFLKAFSKMCLK